MPYALCVFSFSRCILYFTCILNVCMCLLWCVCWWKALFVCLFVWLLAFLYYTCVHMCLHSVLFCTFIFLCMYIYVFLRPLEYFLALFDALYSFALFCVHLFVVVCICSKLLYALDLAVSIISCLCVFVCRFFSAACLFYDVIIIYDVLFI